MKHELIEERAGGYLFRIHARSALHRFLPRPARAVHRKAQGVQAAFDRRRLLEGQREEPAAPAHLRHGFFTKKDLDDYLNRLEEAKKRDHRRVGKELELFTVNELVGAGLPLWLPKGATVRRVLEEYILERERATGYQHVYTPDLAKVELYQRSGHWEHYHEDMFPPMDLETEQMVLRPMNCPHHILIYKSKMRSYRDLPVRIAELGTMYRYERSGVLSGLSRVRSHDAERRAHLLHAGPDQRRIHRRDAACRSAPIAISASRNTAIACRSAIPPTRRSTSTTRRCGSSANACCARPWIRSGCLIRKRPARPPSTAPSSISSSPT